MDCRVSVDLMDTVHSAMANAVGVCILKRLWSKSSFAVIITRRGNARDDERCMKWRSLVVDVLPKSVGWPDRFCFSSMVEDCAGVLFVLRSPSGDTKSLVGTLHDLSVVKELVKFMRDEGFKPYISPLGRLEFELLDQDKLPVEGWE